MFERFDPDAREVLVRAQAEALRLHHGWLGCEHLLLALTTDRAEARHTLNAHGVTHSSVDRAIERLVGRGVTDADALASIGIGLGEVRVASTRFSGPARSTVPSSRSGVGGLLADRSSAVHLGRHGSFRPASCPSRRERSGASRSRPTRPPSASSMSEISRSP